MKVFDSADTRLGINKASRIKIRLIRIREDFIIVAPLLQIDAISYINHK
jgi:hypothetical protein